MIQVWMVKEKTFDHSKVPVYASLRSATRRMHALEMSPCPRHVFVPIAKSESSNEVLASCSHSKGSGVVQSSARNRR